MKAQKRGRMDLGGGTVARGSSLHTDLLFQKPLDCLGAEGRSKERTQVVGIHASIFL